jgi:hypothetical protein
LEIFCCIISDSLGVICILDGEQTVDIMICRTGRIFIGSCCSTGVRRKFT